MFGFDMCAPQFPPSFVNSLKTNKPHSVPTTLPHTWENLGIKLNQFQNIGIAERTSNDEA
jgi:hypothetical protein